MNEQEQAELAQLKARQTRLEQELAALSNQLKLFEDRLTASPTSIRIPVQPAAPPPTLSQFAKPGLASEPTPAAKPGPSVPPPIPPIIRVPVTGLAAAPPVVPAAPIPDVIARQASGQAPPVAP